MSRSRKKNPIIKCPSIYKKRRYNKIIRKCTKSTLKNILISNDKENYVFKKEKEIINQWDIHDYTMYLDLKKEYNKKYLRK